MILGRHLPIHMSTVTPLGSRGVEQASEACSHCKMITIYHIFFLLEHHNLCLNCLFGSRYPGHLAISSCPGVQIRMHVTD